MQNHGHSASDARICLHQRLHLIRISRHDNQHVIPVVFHLGDQRCNGLSSKIIVGMTFIIQCICLIDKEHGAIGVPTDRRRLYGRLSNIFCDKISAAVLKKGTLSKNSLLAHDLTNNSRNRCLSRSGRPRKTHVNAGTLKLLIIHGNLNLRDDLLDSRGNLLHANKLRQCGIARQLCFLLPDEAINLLRLQRLRINFFPFLKLLTVMGSLPQNHLIGNLFYGLEAIKTAIHLLLMNSFRNQLHNVRAGKDIDTRKMIPESLQQANVGIGRNLYRL